MRTLTLEKKCEYLDIGPTRDVKLVALNMCSY